MFTPKTLQKQIMLLLNNHKTFGHPAKLTNKLATRWKGPFVVIKKLGEVDYVVQKQSTAHKTTLHIDDIKVYDHDDIPESWLHTQKELSKQTQTEL